MPIPSTSIDVVEVQMRGTVSAAGSSAKNIDSVFHFRRTATVLAVSKTQVETAFDASIGAAIIAALNNRYTQTQNTIRWVNDAVDQAVGVSRAGVGAIAGDSMPVSASAYLNMVTGLRGRSYKGGKHFGPMSESDTTGATSDLFNAAALVRLNAVAAAILAGFTDAAGNVWVPSILSRKQSQMNVNPTSLIYNDVTLVSTNKRVGWMRHRRVASVY